MSDTQTRELETEVERLRSEWRKADDGWIAANAKVEELEATLRRLRGDRTYLAAWIETNVPGAVVNATGERWRVVCREPTLEWRAMTHHKSQSKPFAQECPDEQFAREWVASEREDYPHAEVWVERRAVGDWERVDG